MSRPDLPRWEYLVLNRVLQHDLNTLGQQGWELVAVTDCYSPCSSQYTTAYLKRRLPELTSPLEA